MKQVKYNYIRLLDIHSVIGAFQTSSILGKDDDSEAMVAEFTRTIKFELENYKANLAETPIIKDIDVKRVKQLFKSYRKMLRNSARHKIPWYLKTFYFEIIDELNKIVEDLEKVGFKTKKF